MKIYRDYGTLESYPAINNEFNYTRHTQVWQATHDGGGNLLSPRQRSFISFTFGDKLIESFGLIACCEGNSMTRNGSADFEDLVTSYDIMDGQYYHGTHFKPNTLSLRLVSDGMDQRQLDMFLHWFRGGVTRELVLMEHPNRAIMARVANTPQLEMLPWEEPIDIDIAGNVYRSSTTLYKGFITLELVADTPFWYAKQNLLLYNSTENQGIFAGKLLVDTNDLFKEAVKIIYEDNVPINNMIQSTMHFGEEKYAIVADNIAYTLIAGPINANDPTTEPEDWASIGIQPGYFEWNGEYWKGARIDGTVTGVTYVGHIAGATMAEERSSVSGPIHEGSMNYQFYYGGNAPSPATISFKINLAPLENADHENDGYINCIDNSYARRHRKEYSTITVKSVHNKEFAFTTPNVITSWNKARSMILNIQQDLERNTPKYVGWSDFSDNIRDKIRHAAVRTFVIQAISYMKDNDNQNTWLNTEECFTQAGVTELLTLLNRFFTDREGNWSTAEFEFNGELGTAIGKFTYWQSESSNTNIITLINTTDQNIIAKNYKEHTENVGDMLRSNWLILEDQNLLVNNSYISGWTDTNKTNAHVVVHDVRGDLIDFKITYKNRYL